jgi:hypothetical protein
MAGPLEAGWLALADLRIEDAASFARARLRVSPRDRDAGRLLTAAARRRVARCAAEGDVDGAEDALLHWFPSGVPLELEPEVTLLVGKLVAGDKGAARALRLVRSMRDSHDAKPWRALEAVALDRLAEQALTDDRGVNAAIELYTEARVLAPDSARRDERMRELATRLAWTLLSEHPPEHAVLELEWLDADAHEPLHDVLAAALDARAVQRAAQGRVEEAREDLARAGRLARSPAMAEKIDRDRELLAGWTSPKAGAEAAP